MPAKFGCRLLCTGSWVCCILCRYCSHWLTGTEVGTNQLTIRRPRGVLDPEGRSLKSLNFT